MLQTVLLLLGAVHSQPLRASYAPLIGQIDTRRFPVVDIISHFSKVRPPNRLVDGSKTKFGHPTSHIFSNHKQIIDHTLWLALKLFTQHLA